MRWLNWGAVSIAIFSVSAPATTYTYDLSGGVDNNWAIDSTDETLLFNSATGDITSAYTLRAGDVVQGSITLDHAYTVGAFSQGYQIDVNLGWSPGYVFNFSEQLAFSYQGSTVTPSASPWLYGSTGGSLNLGTATSSPNSAFTFDHIDFSVTITALNDNSWNGVSGVPMPDTWAYIDVTGHGTQLSSSGFDAQSAPSPSPEPASWVMMIGGFGAIGAALRRRTVAVSFV